MESKPHEANWYVVYTRFKTERKVASLISGMGIESYLPLHKVIKQWSDRKKKLEVPLFPNYVFVRIDSAKKGLLLSIKGLIRFVSIQNTPVVVREKEISTIKMVLAGAAEVTTEEYFVEGVKVRINEGHLAGLEGFIIRRYQNTRLLVRIESLLRAYSFNVPSRICRPINDSQLSLV